MNVALMGSVSSSHAALEALTSAGVDVTAVLGLDESQAEHVCDYRSMRALAARTGCPFRSFVKVTESHVASFLRAHAPDLLWVIGLSQLVPSGLIDVARHGGVGFHPTMLPEGRGRAPVAWTILLARRAAVNLFYLTKRPDAGDIIVQREVPVLPDDYSDDLIERTNRVLREVVLGLAPRIKSGDVPRSPQDESLATYYEKRTASDGLIDFSEPTEQVYRLIRAAGRPYHGAFAFAGDRRIVIWRAAPEAAGPLRASERAAPPGSIVRVDPDRGALARTIDGSLWLSEIEVDVSPAGANTAGRGETAAALDIGTRLTSSAEGSED